VRSTVTGYLLRGMLFLQGRDAAFHGPTMFVNAL
jgi:hypothetical protein